MIEMKNYDAPDPYEKSYQYYKDHYLCLWEVTDDEIIDHWLLDELTANELWYENIILPAFRRHRETMTSTALEDRTSSLTAVMDTLSRMIQLLSTLNNHEANKKSDKQPSDLSFSASDTSSDGLLCGDDPGWGDTDDEGEEANAADDAIKIIEGSW